MIRRSIVAKLWLTIVGMVVLVFALLSILLQQFLDNYVYQQQATELTRLATSVQMLVQENDFNLAETVAAQLANVQHAKIVMGAPFSANDELRLAYNHFTDTQKAAFQAGQTVTVRGSTGGSDTVSVYLVIPSANQSGMLAVEQRMSVLNEPLARMRNLIVFATVLGILLTTGLAFVISKNLSRPLIQMNRVAEEMALGNYDGQIEVVTQDEVGRLGRTFNVLANQLEKTITALSLEKDQLSSILTSLADGVVATDVEGYITLANPPALRRLSALLLAELGAPEPTRLPKSLLSVMHSVIETKETTVREMLWQGRNVVVTMTPLYESDGVTVRGVVSVLRDVTEERRLDRLRKDFIANVSHELRTPLSMMQGYSEALLDEFGDDPKQRTELTEIIHDETMRMKRLVNDLLDLAQLESGQFQMAYEELDLVTLIRRVTRKFQTLATERGVDIEAYLPDESVMISADIDRLEQVFTNLVDNALRHTQADGNVHIRVKTSNKYAQVRVSDTGSGIPDEDIPFIWERFYKADKARTRGASGGTGLGLAITKHIVSEHGGDIIVDSKVGEGTTFTVTIPRLGLAG